MFRARHELFDRNPIRLVRQGAKRRTTPSVLTPAEIKVLIGERVSAGLLGAVCLGHPVSLPTLGPLG